MIGLGLFHGFSKVLIAVGVEPEPGTMATTELPTPDTSSIASTLDTGFAAAERAVEVTLAGHTALLGAVRTRIAQLLGAGNATVEPVEPDCQPWIDLAELFVIDVHAIDDASFEHASKGIDPAVTVTLLVAMALADARARIDGATMQPDARAN